MAGEIPVTRIPVDEAEQTRLRGVIRGARTMGGRWTPEARVARPEDAAALARLLGDPAVGPLIYTLPNPATPSAIRAFIERHLEEQAEGLGVLFIDLDRAGEVTAYFDVELYPEWSAVKFGGAVRPERQGRGFGGVCGLAAMEWCFDVLGVSRVCETTALNNHRSIRLLQRLGMTQMGEVLSVRPDGTTRPSLYWEIARETWKGYGANRLPGLRKPTAPAEIPSMPPESAWPPAGQGEDPPSGSGDRYSGSLSPSPG